MVGFTQLVGCRATTVRGVELNAVQFSWMGPTGNTLINNTRVAILPKRQHQNNFSSEVLFDYLREGDQGVYTCTVVILNARVSASLNTLPSELAHIIECKMQYDDYTYVIGLAKTGHVGTNFTGHHPSLYRSYLSAGTEYLHTVISS